MATLGNGAMAGAKSEELQWMAGAPALILKASSKYPHADAQMPTLEARSSPGPGFS